MKKCPKCGVEYADTTTLCPADGVALETKDDSLIGKTLAGKYRVDARLSVGGMGAVYRGTHILMDKTVAIKVLRPSLAADEKIVARFSREARAASRISHPNALSVTDFGEDEDGIVFLVMEYLSGKTLKQVIRDDGPLSLSRTVDIMRQVGDALAAAHAQNVVHRDLKSDNIMLLTTAVGDHAKVLDFGIAKINEPEDEFDAGLTAPNLVIGTPQYMSPEQCSQDSEIDARSDIYSFGVILYEMLVGHVPFTGESPTMVMMKHLQDPVPSVLDERKDLPPAIGRVIARAMAKLPANRYQTINELIEDLTIAAGMTLLRLDPVSHQTTPPVAEDPDEVTIVRPRVEAPGPGTRRAPVTVPIGQPQPPVPAARSGFNPLKVLIPSVVGLLVVFAVIFAFTRNSTPNANTNTNSNQGPGLVSDPNSQPVQPSQPPSGRGEAGIPSGGVITPPVDANANVNINANTNTNANAEVSPSPLESVTPIANSNANENSNRKAPSLPEPTKATTPDNVPPPTPPGAKPSPSVKPVATPVSSPDGR
ncbi:MAG TPA: protein kinase [Pyrinomonadaceae bacterium]